MSAASSKRRKCTGRSLRLRLARQVLVGDRVDGRQAFDLHPDPTLDADEARERHCPFDGILVLDQHRRLEVGAVGDERVVRVELLLDAVLLERLLDPQHLLDLVANRELILEDERHVVPEMHRAGLLVGEDAGAELGACLRVGLERKQAVARDRHRLSARR
jgi:hypothetical protein